MKRPTRWCAALGAGLVLAACGGDNSLAPIDSGGSQHPPGTPATITVLAGDGQSAAAGSALPTAITVLVSDAAGTPLPGVSVRFAIDSGGGALSATAATTAANGVATGPVWTLGATPGTANVATVSVSSLPIVRVRARSFDLAARTLIDSVSVGVGGGTLVYSKPGDPLHGTTLVVPPNAYSTATRWSIVADSSLRVPLRSGLTQVGPVLVVGNGQGMANALISLTIPARVSASDAVAPFYYDPASGTLEGIPLVGRTDSSITLATGHFSVNEMVIPGSGPALASFRALFGGSAARSALTMSGFGAVQVVLVKMPILQLSGTQTTNYHAGVDDWEFKNFGDYIAPDGSCEGMSITSMYYHYLYRSSSSSPFPYLFHHFDKSLPNQWDNVQGIRLAGSVQGDIAERFRNLGTEFSQIKQNALIGSTPIAHFTANWILLTLNVTQRPVLVGLVEAGGPGGHAVVAYEATNTLGKVDVSFADPNDPGVPTRVMHFGAQGLSELLTLSASASSPGKSYGAAYALNATGEVPLERLQSRWAEFTNGKAGQDRYPTGYTLEVATDLANTFKPLKPGTEVWTTKTDQPQFNIRFVCAACPRKSPAGGDIQSYEVWRTDGSAKAPTGGLVPDGLSSTLFVLKALSPFQPGSNDAGFVDTQTVIVRYHPLEIKTSELTAGTAATLTLSVGLLGLPTSVYTWTITDGTTTTTTVVTGDSTIRPVLTGPSVRVLVSLSDPVHGLLGVARSTYTINSAAFVRFTIAGAWDPIFTPPNGTYSFGDDKGARVPGGFGTGDGSIDAITFAYDVSPTDQTVGVLFGTFIPVGTELRDGQVFTLTPRGAATKVGDFALLLATNLNDPADKGSAQYTVWGTGILTVDGVGIAADGTHVAHYSFNIAGPMGGTIIGTGVARWK